MGTMHVLLDLRHANNMFQQGMSPLSLRVRDREVKVARSGDCHISICSQRFPLTINHIMRLHVVMSGV